MTEPLKYDGVTCGDHTQKASGLTQPPAPFNKPFFMTLTQSLGVARTLDAFEPAGADTPDNDENPPAERMDFRLVGLTGFEPATP